MNPHSPAPSSHRTIKKIVDSFYGGIPYRESQYVRIVEVFGKMGGSWVDLEQGSLDDLRLLKRIIKVAVKEGILNAKKTNSAG